MGTPVKEIPAEGLADLSTDELQVLVQELARSKKACDQAFRRSVSRVMRQIKTLQPPARRLVREHLLDGLALEDMTEKIARTVGPKALRSSFRACLTLRTRLRALNSAYVPEWTLCDRLACHGLLDDLGVRRPAVHASEVPLRDLQPKPHTAVKPMGESDARGVFLIMEDDHIVDLSGRQTLASWDAARERAAAYLRSGRVRKDLWLMEELITDDSGVAGSARDLKFYCFYGKVELVLEVRRYPRKRYCWWSPEGEPIQTGKYQKLLHVGSGFTQENLAFCERISSEIPAPFVRIDCLAAPAGLVFGEFCPRPGRYEEFDAATDRRLGDSHLAAEGRLMLDMLAGKQFPSFAAHLHRLQARRL